MKKFFQIILGISFLFLLVGCSSQETATLTQKSGDTNVTLVYTYDKKTDTVTKIKIETNEPAEHTEARKDNEKLFEEIKGIDGVVTSLTEKDGKLISSAEIDLTKYKFSKLKESNNYFFTGLVQSGFLTEDGDHASFSKSKEVALKRGMTEQTK
jgi:lipoprotein